MHRASSGSVTESGDMGIGVAKRSGAGGSEVPRSDTVAEISDTSASNDQGEHEADHKIDVPCNEECKSDVTAETKNRHTVDSDGKKRSRKTKFKQ